MALDREEYLPFKKCHSLLLESISLSIGPSSSTNSSTISGLYLAFCIGGNLFDESVCVLLRSLFAISFLVLSNES